MNDSLVGAASAAGVTTGPLPAARIAAPGPDPADAARSEAGDHDGPPLRVVIVVETFARDMGYVSSTLPKYLARLGHDVHVVTSQKLPYFQQGSAERLFGDDFAERNRNRVGSESLDGYTVHTLPSRDSFGYPRLQGLDATIAKLRPEVVCCIVAVGWIALDCAMAARRQGLPLVIGNHTGKTSFALARSPSPWHDLRRVKSFLLRELPGRWIATVAHRCVVPTIDCGEVAAGFFGIPRAKIVVMNLPVDSDHFHVVRNDADVADREALRASFGFGSEDIVCVYSGKFSAAKNPLVLQHAIALLAKEGYPVRSLFVGAGEQAEALSADPRSTVVAFRPFHELGRFYRACDIGVWTEESISFLDAASSGLPLVLGDTVKDVSHVREFSARFVANDPASLADAIRPLLDRTRRREASQKAASLARERFGALRYVRARLTMFRHAIQNSPSIARTKST